MSEFSESYHLKTSNQDDGVNLLKRAGLRGYVFPSGNGWVTIVVEGSEFEAIQELIDANNGQLVHYISAEDHGWAISIYSNNVCVCGYECGWDDEISIDTTNLNTGVIFGLANGAEVDSDELKEIFFPKGFDDIFGDDLPSYKIANILGLEHYQWVSYDYIDDIVRSGESGLDIDLNTIVHVG